MFMTSLNNNNTRLLIAVVGNGATWTDLNLGQKFQNLKFLDF